MTTPPDAAALAIAWATLKATRGETVTYTSGSNEVEITAVFTKPNGAQVDGEENFTIVAREWDILIDPTWPDGAAAYFATHQPEHGDKITRRDGTEYRVQPGNASDATWRWSDGLRTWRRVFIDGEGV